MSQFRVSDSGGFREELARQLCIASKEIIVLSGYVRSEAIQWLAATVPESFEGKVTIVTRWAAPDLASGASDLAAFSVAESRGWGFYIHRELHAKCITVDGHWMSVGSANITRRGLGISRPPNVELVSMGLPSPDVAVLVRQIVDSSVMATPEMVAELASVLEHVDAQNSSTNDALEELNALIDRIHDLPKRLTTSDLFQTTPSKFKASSEDERTHDTRLLGVTKSPLASPGTLQERLPETKVWRWLIAFLKIRAMKTASFGELTQALHDELAVDGRIRRSEVKRLLANTLDWIEIAKPDELRITKHRATITVTLKMS